MLPLHNLNICIFCGSSTQVSQELKNYASKAAAETASLGANLIYGGTNYGMMGIVAHEFLKAGRHVTGIIPEELHTSCESALRDIPGIRLIVVKDMFERKEKMMAMSNAFITLPGGIGTLDELTEVWSHRFFHEFCPELPYAHTKPILLPTDNRINLSLLAHLKACVDENLISPTTMSYLITGPWWTCLTQLANKPRTLAA